MKNYKMISAAFVVFIINCTCFQKHLYAQNSYGSFVTGTTVTGIKVMVDDATLLPGNLGNSRPRSQATSSSSNQKISKLTPNITSNASPTSNNQSQKVLYNNTSFFSKETLCGYISEPIRELLSNELKSTMFSSIKQKMPSGFGLHSQSNLQLGNGCDAYVNFISSSTPKTVIEYIIPRIRTFLRITTPDGFPGSLDPNFILFFDLVVRVPISLPTATDQVNHSFVKDDLIIEVKNISKPETRSVTGNLAIAMNDVSSFLGGPDFIAALRKNQDFEIALRDLKAKDYFPGIKQYFASVKVMRIDNHADRNSLVMKATNREVSKPK